ncbi:MAG: polysaccharide pyruvyl transferase family protein [Kiritimatiellae bacterium]|nr:polysaccharide pyruvyl transferase family protein [Kiritimatiellia bacterium]
MRIGIITLIDVNNYGGVLQAAAIQDYLCQAGHDAVLLHVQYNRKRNSFLKFLERPAKGVLEAVKARQFAAFRHTHFRMGEFPCFNLSAFLSECPGFDAYVCGSDQIWNPGNCADDLKRRLFFLDFGTPEAKRVSYAASWGSETVDDRLKPAIAGLLKRFDAVSVREKSGVEIVSKMGLSAAWVPDPTLLHDAGYWGRIADEAKQRTSAKTLFMCEYRWSPCVPLGKVREVLCETYGWRTVKPFSNRPFREMNFSCLSPSEWLDEIRRASFVLSNSYHGILFSIIFQRPFMAVPLIGKYAGMNDRIFSVTNRLGLQNRILTQFDPDQIQRLAETPVDWADVGQRLAVWRGEADTFLSSAL